MRAYDIIVVGGGHAGIEATLAAARRGMNTLLVTLNKKMIGAMNCNPSIGGPAKGIVAREIDALGGEMGKAADETALQFKMLNTAKGPGVQNLRVQSDKVEYARYMQRVLETTPGVTIQEIMAIEVVVKDGQCTGVILEDGEELSAKAVILTTGTYLKGKILIGHDSHEAGPDQQRAAIGISDSLARHGIPIVRYKTGTPPRLDKHTIDYTQMKLEPGTVGDFKYSHTNTKRLPYEQQWPCYLLHTQPKTHEIINLNLGLSAMYGGKVEGVGPRYCPSIEDKIVRFADKERHQLFIEPESVHLDTAYLQGFSSSMPVHIQDQMIRSLPGLENVKVIKYAYAIEYDAIDPTYLKPTLELKAIPHLYCAGQINGTSGYEEAASQGLMASINAVNSIRGLTPFILRRDEAYIGVMIDDLVTKGTKEPYRLLTSRAEFRLLLRHDNADLRLMTYGYELGLIPFDQYNHFLAKKQAITDLIELCKTKRFTPKDPLEEILKDAGYEPLTSGISALEIIRRPGIELVDLLPLITNIDFDHEVVEQVEIQIKYEGYLSKQEKEVKESMKFETYTIPETMDYKEVPNLATEARQKLTKIRPITIGQASRISGVNPADINMLLLYLKMQTKHKTESHV